MAPPTRLLPSSALYSPSVMTRRDNDDEVPSTSPKDRNGSEEGYFPRINKRSSASQSTQSLLTTDKPTLLSLSTGDMSDVEQNPRTRLGSIYLTPPEERDLGIPPYKPTRKDSSSLKMTKNTKTVIHNGLSPYRKHGSKISSRSSRRSSKNIHQKQPTPWWTANDQARSTMLHSLLSPVMRSSESSFQKSDSMETSNEHQTRLLRFMSNPAIPITTRRWSSVEIGAGAMPMKGTRYAFTKSSKAKRHSEKLINRQQECIDAVNKILTSKKISIPRVDTPATITLRRASPPSPSLEISRSSSTYSLLVSQTAIPFAEKHLNAEAPISAYLITAHEIGKITTLIQDNMVRIKAAKYKSKAKNKALDSSQTSPQVPRKLSVTTKGLIPDQSSTLQTATTVTNIPGAFPESQSRWNSQSIVTPKNNQRGRQFSVVVSRDSVHEIIWENDGHPRRLSSTSAPSFSSSGRHSQEKVFSHDVTVWKMDDNKLSTDISPMMQPSSSSSLSESGGSPSKRSSDPPSPLSEHKRKFKTYNPFNTIDIPKVESFPALPARKGTSDWISPLPSMHSRESTSESNALYSQGIDATRRAASTLREEPEQFTTIHNGSRSDTSLPRFSTQESPHRHRKSSVTPHAEANHRLSASNTTGFAIGSSSHVRRPSTPRSPRVKIAAPPPSRRKAWKKPRKDSGYPGRAPELEISDEEQEERSVTDNSMEKGLWMGSRNGRISQQLRDSTHPEIVVPRESDEDVESQSTNEFTAPRRRSIWSKQVSAPSTGSDDRERRKRRKDLSIYESLTGADGSDGDDGAGNEFSEGMRTPSVDWIG